MKLYYWIVLAVAAVLALPVLVTPAGWALAAVLVVGWVLLATAGRWAARELLDLKKSRESGMKAQKFSDKVSGDDRRWKR
jgi:arginine exporter protein ArgO